MRRTADLVFGRARVAVFLDGCYWHGCSTHYTLPATNAAYWGPKIEGNVARDRITDHMLRAAGWTGIRVWEHEDPVEAAERIRRIVRRRLAENVGPR